jgi:hypothetical protein
VHEFQIEEFEADVKLCIDRSTPALACANVDHRKNFRKFRRPEGCGHAAPEEKPFSLTLIL